MSGDPGAHGLRVYHYGYILSLAMRDAPRARALYWVGSSKRDLMRLPDAVIDVLGYAFYLAGSAGSTSKLNR